MLLFGAKAHDLLDPGAVIPRTVEEDDLPGRRQVHDVTLEIPLPTLTLGRDIERDDPRGSGIKMLHETLYSTALAGGVTAFKDNDNTLARILDPVLQLEQFHLQQSLQMIVFIAAQSLGIGILLPPGIHQAPVGVTEHRVILVGIVHPYARRHHVRAAWAARAGVSLSHIQILSMPLPAVSVAGSRCSTALVAKVHQEFTAPARSGTCPFAHARSRVRPPGPSVPSLAHFFRSYCNQDKIGTDHKA